MLGSGTAAAVVLALGTAVAVLVYLALLAGYLLRAEGINEIRVLLELQHELNRQRVRAQVDQFGAASPMAQKVISTGERSVAAAIRKALKS